MKVATELSDQRAKPFDPNAARHGAACGWDIVGASEDRQRSAHRTLVQLAKITACRRL